MQHFKWFLIKLEGYYLDKTETFSQAQVSLDTRRLLIFTDVQVPNLRYTLHEKVVVVSVTEASNPYETILQHSYVTPTMNFLSADFGYSLFLKRTMF